MISGRWTAHEDAMLRRLHGRMSRPQIARLLGRSVPSVNGRAGMLGLRRRKEPRWADAEIDFLRHNHGRLTEAQIARLLGRTNIAVRIKSRRLALGHCYPPGCFTLREASSLIGFDCHVVMRWINLGWLHAERRVTKSKPVMVIIAVNDLVNCLRDHVDAWDARRAPGLWQAIRNKRFETPLESNHPHGEVGDDEKASTEPLWLIEKRRADATLPPNRLRKWNRQDDDELQRFFSQRSAQGMTYRRMGEILGRSTEAVEHRIVRLGLREKRLEGAAS